MKFEVHIRGAKDSHVLSRTIELSRTREAVSEFSAPLRIQLEGRALDVDISELNGNIYSILIDGCAFEARVLDEEPKHGTRVLSVRCGGQEFTVEVRDPRAWRGQQNSVVQAEGRQQVVSPMPGKVVRVLVVAGETVQARQGLLVVEAMKMQNEIRAPKSGSIEKVFVREGQTVAAGEGLISIA